MAPEPQSNRSNSRRVSFAQEPDEKGGKLDRKAAALLPSWKFDGSRPVWFTDADANCIESGCGSDSSFEKGFGAGECRCTHHTKKRRSFLSGFFALLAAAGLFVWNLGPGYLLSSVSTLEHQVYKFNDLNQYTIRNLIGPGRRYIRFRNSFVQILSSEEQTEDIVVDFSFKTSNPRLQNLVEVKKTDDSLTIEFPAHQLDAHYGEWIETQTKIHVRSGLKLSKFEIESSRLGISVPSYVDMWADDAIVKCHSGSLAAHPFIDSRRTVIRHESGSISGSFPLFDLLDIGTHSGSVGINVNPRPANEADVQPAKFIASANSGSINVDYQIDYKLYSREYQVKANSHSGYVGGRFVHGSLTQLSSHSSSISATLLPYSAEVYESDITTTTTSGSQSITVLPPEYDPKKSLTRLEGTHRSVSGSVNVHYPKAWEGTVEALSTSGSLSVHGPGLRIVKEGRGKFIEAKKGDGEGTTLCKSGSGSVQFTVDAV